MENLDFPMTEKYTQADIKRVQDRLMEMANITIKILTDNGFRYYICYGTLLGAMRHQGFIPWDDDFDLFLFDEEYDDAMECLRKNLPDDIIVHDKETDPIYWPAWSRLRDANSKTSAVLYPDDNAYKYTGINLDLYRMYTVKRKEAALFRKRSAIEFLVRKHDVKVMSDEEFRVKFDQWTREYAHMLVPQANAENDDDLVFTSPAILIDYFEYDDILPLREYDFDGQKFLGPNNADLVLRKEYGDYMQFPPYEKRIPHYDEVCFDISKEGDL